MPTIRPLYDRVLIKRKDAETVSSGGLIIPTQAQEKSNLALIVAVGNGSLRDDGSLVPLKVEEGMTVLIGKWSGDEIRLDGEEHLIIRETDILAVVDS